MTSRHSALTAQRVQEYCDLRLGPVLPPDQVKSLSRYLTALLGRGEYPPYRGSSLDIRAVAESLDMEPSDLSAVRALLKPIFDAVSREVTEQPSPAEGAPSPAASPECGQKAASHRGISRAAERDMG